MDKTIKTKKALLKMKLGHYHACCLVVEEQQRRIDMIDERMVRLPSPSLMEVKSSVFTSLEELITLKDEQSNRLHSMSEYWIVKEVGGYLDELEDSTEKEMIMDIFIQKKPYKDIASKYGYAGGSSIFSRIEQILRKMLK